MAATIKNVAEAAGVSTATVSHVLNKTRYVSRDTVAKVQTAMDQLGYVPNANARGLRSNRTKRIGLLVPSISSFFTVDILDSVERIFLKRGYQMVLGCSHESLEREKEQVEVFNYQQIDGMIMFPAPGDHSYLDQMERQYPIVFLDRLAENCERDAVLGDNEEAAYRIVSEMIRAGHTNIGVIDGTQGVTALSERIEGYKRALADNDIPFIPEFVKNGGSKLEGGYDAMRLMMEDGRPTATLVLSPIMALGSLRYLISNQVNIPGRMALISFGDSVWADVTAPPMTAMRHPLFEMGQAAAEQLLLRLEEEQKRNGFEESAAEREPYKTIRMPIETVRRETF